MRKTCNLLQSQGPFQVGTTRYLTHVLSCMPVSDRASVVHAGPAMWRNASSVFEVSPLVPRCIFWNVVGLVTDHRPCCRVLLSMTMLLNFISSSDTILHSILSWWPSEELLLKNNLRQFMCIAQRRTKDVLTLHFANCLLHIRLLTATCLTYFFLFSLFTIFDCS